MDDKYKNITVEGLLQDEDFISSVVSPTPQSEIFWNRMLADGHLDPACFKQARGFLLSLSARQLSIPEERIKAVWERINETVGAQESVKPRGGRPRSRTWWLWPVATMVSAACIGLAILLRPAVEAPGEGGFTINGTSVTSLNNSAQSDIITLSLGDKTVNMHGDEAYLDYSEGNLRINEQEVASSKSGNLNMLAVPFGKRSTITLSDGSRLWVNAGTKVIYPDQFADDKREIYVNGEIYARITHNPQRPFLIKTSKADVSVLGTTLNVNAYEMEREIEVVLVEGRVAVAGTGGGSAELAPNQMYFASGDTHQIRSVDVDDHISWKDGVYRFRNEQVGNIIKRLGRYYNVNIQASEAARGLTCSGELILKDELSRVLDGICKTTQITYRWDSDDNTYYLSR